MTLTTRVELLLTPRTGQLLETFFHADSVFAGTTFEDWTVIPADRFTTSDLVAVSLLDIRLAARAVKPFQDAGVAVDTPLRYLLKARQSRPCDPRREYNTVVKRMGSSLFTLGNIIGLRVLHVFGY